MSWVRKHLSSVAGVVMAGTLEDVTRLPDDLDPAVVDMCLLSSCNHSISSQGQFGQWAAYLAAGDVFTLYGPVSSNVVTKNSTR